MKNGIAIPYALVKLDEFEFNPNVTIEYLGGATERPSDMVLRHGIQLQQKRKYHSLLT